MDAIIAQLILQDRKVGYCITDRDLKIVELSGFLHMIRNGHDAVLGRSLLELAPELVGSEDTLADILAGELSRFELPLVSRSMPDGQPCYLTIVELPYRNAGGRITGVIHLVQDVTDRGLIEQRLTQQHNELRLLEEELQRQNLRLAAANAELQRLDEAKSAFVSIAAHELRTPLTAIAGYLEVLLEEDGDPLTQRQREYLTIIQGSAARLLRVVNELLDLARIEAGRLELVLRPVDLARLVETVALEYAPQIEAKSQRLTLRAAAGLPLAFCDQARAGQIVGNLLSNANKYAPIGGSILVSLTPAADEGFLQIAVQDNGIGIAAADQPKLFNRFFRAGNAAASDTSGAGLGLHITRALVELHGGRIWVQSELGRGATFYVTLPAIGD